jgi:signal transduction histidine kinase/CheY-like chemotaxis protein
MIRHGIERQTLAIAMIPILILALILESYFTFTRFADLDRALFERAKLIVHQLASASEYPVFSGNQGLLQQQVDIAFSQTDVNSVVVLDNNLGYLAGAGSSISHNLQKTTLFNVKDVVPIREDHDAMWLYHPIVATQIELDELSTRSQKGNVSKPLGSVIIEIGKGHLNSQKMEMLALNLLVTLLILVTTLLIAMRVSRRITQPVLEMSNAIRRIGEGHLDTHIGDAKVRELDGLAHGINDMARQLLLDRDTMIQRVEEATLELRYKKEEAEKANYDKTRFLAAASHDLRQPMHALGLFVGELYNKLDTPEQRKIVGKVEESVEAMSSLLDSLLDISKLDAGVVIPQLREIDIDSMMTRLIQDLSSVAQRKSITLRVHSINSKVLSDPVLLERILINLLGNAIRYTPQNGTVLLACRKRGENLLIEVRDNGVGIPAEEQRNIFREFVQLANNARDRSKGLGLGLAIVERLSKLLDHSLAVRSEPGKGSSFSILVPRIFGVEDLLFEPLSAAPEQDKHDKLEGLNVLVVDDDLLVRTSTGGILTSWGCHVSLAESLQEVGETYANSKFDLVVCDYRLPDGDGLELFDRIKELCDAPPPFILVSGDTAPEILQAVNERGLNLLHKPVRPAKLRSLILFLLKRQEENIQ